MRSRVPEAGKRARHIPAATVRGVPQEEQAIQ